MKAAQTDERGVGVCEVPCETSSSETTLKGYAPEGKLVTSIITFAFKALKKYRLVAISTATSVNLISLSNRFSLSLLP